MIQQILSFGSNSAHLSAQHAPLMASVEANDETLLLENRSEDVFEQLDVSSGLVEATTLISFNLAGKYDALVYSKRIAMLYNTGVGQSNFSVYDLSLGSYVHTGHLPFKSTQRIVSVRASPCKEGLFFVGIFS